MKLSQFVKTRRAELGLSLQQLADRTGCSKSYIHVIEKADYNNNPSAKTICALAAGLQISDVKLFRIITDSDEHSR